MIQRIFHPIGQGAFYSERHDDFNIVYDCGTHYENRSDTYYDKVVRQSFTRSDVIDILFISHFDYDHVSKIEVLKNHVKQIKHVILPLLHDEEKILISNFYRNLDFDVSLLITDPEQFFGDKCRVIYVNSSNDDNSDINNSPTDIENIIPNKINGKFTVASGRGLKIGKLQNWVFIPYNHEYTDRNTKLLEMLAAEELDCYKLQTDAKYTLDKIKKDLGLSKSKGGKIFQRIYDELDGEINQNSMLVYSGPSYKSTFPRIECFTSGYGYLSPFYFRHLIGSDNRMACVFTGDADLNITHIKDIYEGLWEYVGTIQISHHGDLKTFNENDLSDGRSYICPISFGKTNTYGHPSSLVIAKILSRHSYPIYVTEDPTSVLIQNFERRL